MCLNRQWKCVWMKIRNMTEWKLKIWLNKNWKCDWMDGLRSWFFYVYDIYLPHKMIKYALILDVVYVISVLEKELTYIESRVEKHN